MCAIYAAYVKVVGFAYAAVDVYSAGQHHAHMSEPNSERIITPMPKSLVQAIDDFRFGNRVASRAEAIRQLIELGLKTAQGGETKPAKAQAR
jgi:metal-responsive CopG/Arc/MetJ family transcriptional regulator